MEKSDEPTLITAQPVHGRHSHRSRPIFNYEDFKVIATNAVTRFGETEANDLADAGYREEYDILARWFADQMARKSWTAEAVRIGALAIYGWMPRVLRVHGQGELSSARQRVDFAGIADALNRNDDSRIEKNFLNRSYVGTSKFLHFCWPEHYAIWDSNIKLALGWSGPEKQSFYRYQRYMHVFCKERGSYTLRLVEFALFRLGKEQKRIRKGGDPV